MLKTHLKIFIRNLFRNKSQSLITIFGLAVGIACAVLILLWVVDELSYDRFHSNADEIYRVLGRDGLIGEMSVTCGPLAGHLEKNYPEVVDATRYMPYAGATFTSGENMFAIDKGVFADPAFFRMFSTEFLHGDPASALSDLSSIVLTRSTAERFFADENPIGKTLLMDGQSPMTVTGVVADPPANSQIQFRYLINVEVLKYIGMPLDSWDNAAFHTFIQVREDTRIPALNVSISNIMSEQIPGFNRTLYLQPLTDIHLTSGIAHDLSGIGDPKYVLIFSAIALFLILIACINYINLSTARSLKRSKEVGLRKILGADRSKIVRYFFTESVVVLIISFIVAAVLVQWLLPAFNQLSAKTLTIDYASPEIILGSLFLLILTASIAGGYPALRFSGANPVTAVKGIPRRGRSHTASRRGLVITQFALSIILLVGTIIVFSQLEYIRNKNLGFNQENVLYFPARGNFVQSYDRLKHELSNYSSIVDVTAEDKMLTEFSNSTADLHWAGKGNQTDLNIGYSHIDANYLELLDVEIVAGRNFNPDRASDRTAYILNEEAIDQMGLEEPVGKRFMLNGAEGYIIGITKDANFNSLHHQVEPRAYMLLDPTSGNSFQYVGNILVKATSGKTEEAIAAIQNIWQRENPDVPFEYHFLDETIDSQYQTEVRTGKIFGYFSLIAILISCLGLYGLTAFIIEGRTKEIGVRKALGATVAGILGMFLSDFSKMILIAGVIAWPVAWFVMLFWLQNFAYRVSLTVWPFLLSGLSALAIALLTVSWQAMRAATANPVESLRYE